MVHLAAVKQTITAEEAAAVFLDSVFRLLGPPETLVSDRDPRFTSLFWRSLFKLLHTQLQMSTAAHPETDGQTESVNRVLEDVLRSYATSFRAWSEFLPLVEFALNNSVHVSSGMTPFYVNYGRHPRVPSSFLTGGSRSGGGGAPATPDLGVPDGPSEPVPSAPPLDGELAAPSAARDELEPASDDYHEVSRDFGDLNEKIGYIGNIGEIGDFKAAQGDTGGAPVEHQALDSPWSSTGVDNTADTETESGPVDGSPDEAMDLNSVEAVLDALLASAIHEKDGAEYNFDALPDLASLTPREEKSINDFVEKRQAIVRFVRDSVADAVDRQKAYADSSGRSNHTKFEVGDRVLLSTQNSPERLVSHLGSSKLLPRYIGPFKITNAVGDTYTLELPPRLVRLHPTFYVGRLKPYRSPEDLAADLRDVRLYEDQLRGLPQRA